MTDRSHMEQFKEATQARIDEFWEEMRAAMASDSPAGMSELIDAEIQRDAEAPIEPEAEPAEEGSRLGAFTAWHPEHKLKSRRAAELLEAHSDAAFADMQAEFERDAESIAADFDAAHSIVERVVARVQS